MQITLRIDEKDKTFVNEFVKARVFRNALKMNEKMRENGNNISADLFDELVEFIVNVFNQQFTVDEFWDGIEASKLQDEIMRVFNEVLKTGGLETNTEGK